jgi:hypothetical protein
MEKVASMEVVATFSGIKLTTVLSLEALDMEIIHGSLSSRGFVQFGCYRPTAFLMHLLFILEHLI